MKTLTFPYYISFGKLDSVSCEIELSISDKDAKRLERSAREGGRFRLSEDEDLSDLYDKVYKNIILFEKDALLSDPSPVKDSLSWEDDYDEDAPITEEQIDHYLDELVIGINYPEEMQLLERTAAKRKRQTTCDSVRVDRSQAQDFVYVENNKDKIVYTDDGETLFFIPSKYSGTFIIPSFVRKLEGGSVYNPFGKHKKIVKVVIEEGLAEIPDFAFEGCENLEAIVIPSSVKRIGFNAFYKCSRLKEVVMTTGLLEINSAAFRFCFDLEELHVPASVDLISSYITSYSTGIRRIFFEGLHTTIVDTGWLENWDRIIVYAKPGSEAEKIAKEYKLRLKPF